MDVVRYFFFFFSVALSALSVTVSVKNFKDGSTMGAPLLVPSSYTFLLVLIYVCVLKELPVEVFCIGTSFCLVNSLPFTSSRFKIVSFSVLMCFVLISFNLYRNLLALGLTSYFALSWIVELRGIKTRQWPRESADSVTANYLVLFSYVFLPILIILLNLLFSESETLLSGLLTCALFIISCILYTFVFSKCMWRDKLILHTTLIASIKSFLDTLRGRKLSDSGDDTDDGHFMPGLYKRFCRYMKESEKFLNPNLKIGEVAKDLYTNKTYLSKSIRDNSGGKSFPKVINSFRVDYAIELFKHDPSLKVIDLARMSGFSSDSNFSLAFKIDYKMAPRDWFNSYKYEHPGDLEKKKKPGE